MKKKRIVFDFVKFSESFGMGEAKEKMKGKVR